jgi:3-hexulose-6-phosphate synthase/6-phospho-3-hexuloisomerase
MPKKPWVQVSIDVLDLERGRQLARMAEDAGADWVEAGTPLITFHGVAAIGAIAGSCRRCPVLADLKACDGVAKYFREAGKQGARIATVLGFAADASIREALRGGREGGVEVMVDLYALDPAVLPRRARELEAMGVHYLLLHAGGDAMAAEPGRDPQAGLAELVRSVSLPVGAVTFGADQAVRAVQAGASFVVQGEPMVSAPDGPRQLSSFITRVHTA